MNKNDSVSYICKQCIKTTLILSENPTMDEELYCISCQDTGIETPSKCLFNGKII